MTAFSPTALLDAVARSRQPHITWYGGPDGSERVELSGHVLANWVAKTANFLDEEGVGGGDVVVVDLPVHWRAVVWVWAAWIRGAAVSFVPDGGSAGGADDGGGVVAVVATDRPERHAGGEALVVAVPLAPLALRWAGDLPAGALDGGDILGQADVLLAPGVAGGAARAVEDSGLSFEDLDAAIGTGDGTRIAFVPGSVWELARTAFSAWRGGGSVVVFAERLSEGRRDELVAQEGARFVE
ncbi:MAG: TIGR03089 family protein [Actinobacteria bacterium]|nr:TIGR03089 family protein [Actinomycetota bacterium]